MEQPNKITLHTDPATDQRFHHAGLRCGLLGINLPGRGVVELRLPEGHCTDMAGAIRLAKAVTKPMSAYGLWCVRTIAGGMLDTSYEHSDGKWVAYCHTPKKAKKEQGK